MLRKRREEISTQSQEARTEKEAVLCGKTRKFLVGRWMPGLEKISILPGKILPKEFEIQRRSGAA